MKLILKITSKEVVIKLEIKLVSVLIVLAKEWIDKL